MRRQIAIQNKSVLTINLHNQGRGEHEVNKSLDMDEVACGEGCMGCTQRSEKENMGRLDQSAYRKSSDRR